MNFNERLFKFNLQNVDGNWISNFDFADKYALLIVVTCNHCPYAQAYWNRLINLSKKFEEDNLGMLAICGNDADAYPQDGFEEMKRLWKDKNLPFPYLHDEKQEVINKLGATRTPEVFLFNRKRELVYKGAIDDNWENENAVMMAYLEDAIDYCLDGIDIDYPETQAVGCSIKWKAEKAPL